MSYKPNFKEYMEDLKKSRKATETYEKHENKCWRCRNQVLPCSLGKYLNDERMRFGMIMGIKAMVGIVRGFNGS